MIDNRRLGEILRPYGVIESVTGQREQTDQTPWHEEGVWTIPIDGDGHSLRIQERDLPPAVAGLLALYVEAHGHLDAASPTERLVRDWLFGEGDATVEKVAGALREAGWPAQGAVIVAIEWSKEAEMPAQEEARQLLADWLDGEQAFVVRQGEMRLWLLLSSLDLARELSAWLHTLGSELYLLARAGVSTPAKELRELERARDEADFALEAGKRYRSQEMIHSFATLGLARVLHGIPGRVREAFLQEVLPQAVLAALSPELRETIFAFWEHGGQVADTARSLFVHRNTLLYRLERIHEITGQDIKKPLQGWTLWLALTISRAQ